MNKTPCPKCGCKGLHTPMHPHAFGYKDVGKLECRFCHARFVERLFFPSPGTSEKGTDSHD